MTSTLYGYFGDVFENRKLINVHVLNRVHRFLEEFQNNNIEVYCLLGNHDVVFKNTNEVSSLVPTTRAFSNVHLIRTFETVDFGDVTVGFISWISPEIKDQALSWIQSVNTNILCGHFEINNFEIIKGVVCHSGFEPAIFDRFDLVLSGHFHIRARSNAIQYVGNPYQTNWGEAGTVKGFHTLDLSTQQLDFIPNPVEIFQVLHYNDDFDIVEFDPFVYQDKIVRIFAEDGKSKNKKKLEMLMEMLSSCCYSIELIEDKEILLDTSDNELITDTAQLIQQFLNSCTISHLNRDLLQTIVFDVYRESLEKGLLCVNS